MPVETISIITAINPYTRLRATDETAATSITALQATATQPASAGVIDLRSAPANAMGFIFFGVQNAVANENFLARINGWRELPLAGSTTLWVPTPLLDLTLTHGTQTGIAGTAIDNTHLFAHQAVSGAVVSAASEIISPGGNSIALVKLDTVGFELIEVQLAKGTNAGANAAYFRF